MRDPRFDLDRGVAGFRRRSIVRGCTVATEGWFDAAVNVLRDWYTGEIRGADIVDADDHVLAPDEALRASLSAIDTLPSARASALADWVSGQAAASGSLEGDPGTDWVWGIALARAALALTSTPDAFEYTWRMAERRPAAGEAYLDGLAAALRRGHGSSLLIVLLDIPGRVYDLRGVHVFSDQREALARSVAQWRETARFPDVWDAYVFQHFSFHWKDLWLLDAVRRYDRSLYLTLLEQMGNPLAVRYALRWADIVEDIDEILALLATAPAACARGAPGSPPYEWNRRLTAPQMIEVGLEHADRLVRLIPVENEGGVPHPDAAALMDDDLPDCLRRVMETTLARDDGTFLAAQWMVHLVHQRGASPRNALPSAAGLALRAAAAALADHGAGLPTFRAVFPDVFDHSDADVEAARKTGTGIIGPGHRGVDGVDVLLALLSIAEASSEEDQPGPRVAEGDKGALRGMLDALLARRDPGLNPSRDAAMPSWRHALVASLFLETPGPDQAWQRSWDALSEQRRRTLHGSYTRDHTADHPSLFLLSTGVAILGRLCAEGDGTVALGLWNRLYEASLSIVLRLAWLGPWPRDERWRGTIPLLFAWLPHAARRAGSDMADPEWLGSLLRRLGGDDELMVEGVANLHLNGVPATTVVDAVARTGARLDDLVVRRTGHADTRTPVSTAQGSLDAHAVCRTILEESRGVALLDGGDRGDD